MAGTITPPTTYTLTIGGEDTDGLTARASQRGAHRAGRTGQPWMIHTDTGDCVAHDGRHGAQISSQAACDAYTDALAEEG